VAWEPDGSLLVLDIRNARMRRIAGGMVTTVAGGDQRGRDDGPPEKASFVAPIDFALAPDQAVYIADAGSGRIARWSTPGGVRTLAANAELVRPHGVAVGADGLVFVAEIGAHRIVSIGADGTVTRVAGTGTAGSAAQELSRPAALLIHAGLLWIADLGNNRILAAPYPR
jgi:serine/threonine-protein kinase